VKNCIRHTYNFLFANCDEVYKRESKEENQINENPSDNHDESINSNLNVTNVVVGPSLKSLQFWHQLVYLLTCIISEDRERYGSVLNQSVEEKKRKEKKGSID
jgi:hypothetical protein